jgi:hypothetical protein
MGSVSNEFCFLPWYKKMGWVRVIFPEEITLKESDSAKENAAIPAKHSKVSVWSPQTSVPEARKAISERNSRSTEPFEIKMSEV